jgi:hypothetical protein
MTPLRLSRIPYDSNRTFARAQDLWHEPHGAHEATGLSTATGNAQLKQAMKRYGHKGIQSTRKSCLLVSTTPPSPHPPPDCRSEQGALRDSPAQAESVKPVIPPHPQAFSHETAIDQSWAWIRRNELLTPPWTRAKHDRLARSSRSLAATFAKALERRHQRKCKI